MFKETITDTCLTSDKANMFFENSIIQDGCYVNDVSLVSTVRALLYDRVDDIEKTFIVSYISREYFSAQDVYFRVNNRMSELEYGICIYNFSGYIDRGELSFENQNCTADGYHKLNKITELCRKKYNVHAFINEQTKSVVIVTFNMDIKQYHFIQCAIVGTMPWWIDTGNVDDDKKALLYSLQKNTSEEYLTAISKIAQKIDFRTEYIKNKLVGFEKYHERHRESELNGIMENLHEQISDLSNRISDKLCTIRLCEAELLGIQMKLQSDADDSEIMNYFLANKHLDLRNVCNGDIDFIAYDYMSYFNEDQAEKYISNMNSYFYRYLMGMTEDDMKKVLTAIFIDKTIKVKMCAAYRLSIENMRVYPLRRYSYGAEYSYTLPNPHTDQYECIGDYRQIFNQCMESRNYVQAIEQAIASAKSVNLSDSTVMNKFMEELVGRADVSTPFGAKCLELPNGEMVGIKDAAKWLNEQEGVANE